MPRSLFVSSSRASLTILFLLFTSATSTPFDCETPLSEPFSRPGCYAKVKSLIDSGQLSSNDTCFYHDAAGTIFSTPEHPTLLPNACKAICGADFGWYPDIGPRFATWLIPVFLLLSNMEVSPLDKRRYLMILHLLGDPIDSLFALITKLEAWSRCHHLATQLVGTTSPLRTRNVATVLGGLEDVVGFHNNPQAVYLALQQSRACSKPHFDALVARAAQQLADNRTDERLRTLLATLLYIYQITSAFVATIGGGQTTTPGGRIGIAMFMTWIIPSILLSNAIGGFTSPRTCYAILESLIADATAQPDAWPILQRAAGGLSRYRSVHEYFDARAHDGAIYTYRPRKRLVFSAGGKDRSPWVLCGLAVSPVVTSSTAASLILWNTPPIGMNCRNILLFSLTGLVFGSAVFTHFASLWFAGGCARRQWKIILIKDAVVAVPSVLLLFLACAGLFNTCWCWSGGYSRGKWARIPLHPEEDFVAYNKRLYPALVTACITLQCAAFIGMIWTGWRGWNLMRWSEREKEDAWRMARRVEEIEIELSETVVNKPKTVVCIEEVE